MCKKFIYLIISIIILSFSSIVNAGVFIDNFSTPHDYLANGVDGTDWSGIMGGDNAAALDTSISENGVLYLQSGGTYWSDSTSAHGPFLYLEVSGDFVATVKVSGYQANVYYNYCGLMARVKPENASNGENFVTIDYFNLYNVGNIVHNTTNNNRAESGTGWTVTAQAWLQLERKGNTFTFRTSTDGVTWTDYADPAFNPIQRTDMDGLTLQVGLWQATYSTAVGYVTFDDFKIEGPKVVSNVGKATNPTPSYKETDVIRDGVVLGWNSGAFVARDGGTHNVYFGTDFDDVNEATSTVHNPLTTTFIQDLTVNSYNLDRLEFNTTYYWRVDEINLPSKPAVYRGDIWQFTVEPVALKLPKENIKATASSYLLTYDPNTTIDESGLDPNNMDLHSNNPADMWLSSGSDVNNVWIRYDFDKVYKLYKMMVWNYNFPLFGIKDVKIEYSEDDPEGEQSWTTLDNVPQFGNGPGSPDYAYNTVVNFNNITARSIKLTVLSNWFNGITFSGLSEVRFMYIPVWAREPNPDNAAVGVLVNPVLLSWRAGRDAEQHYLYLSTDMNSVAENIVSPIILDEASYIPDLTLGKTYFWKVDEVNNAESNPVWEGPVWHFSTSTSIVVDDFETYGATEATAVWSTWIDGYLVPSTNGSIIGKGIAAPGLSIINHYGGHSAPISYDNTGTASYSEVQAQTNNIPIGTSDWTYGSPTTLVIWIYGDLANNPATDRLYAKIGSAKVLFTGNISKPRWMQFNIPLSTPGISLSNVSTVTVGIEKIGATGGTGIVLVDDMRLYNVAPAISTEEYWIEAESGTITAPFNNLTELAGASGGQYIGKADGAGNNTSPITDGSATATYTFTVQGGVYQIQYRYWSINNSDGFWLQLSPAPTAIKLISTGQNAVLTNGWMDGNNMRPRSASWGWALARSNTTPAGDVQFTLPAGTYTLKIANRDDGTMLDAFVISKVANLN